MAGNSCNSGVTGRVLPPSVVETSSDVVVTFEVELDPDGGECPSNDLVPYEVQLEAPLGGRVLVDGGCRSGAPAERTSFCDPDGLRWTPEAEVADGPRPLAVDDPACVEGTAYQIDPGPVGGHDEPAAWYVERSRGLEGGLASLTLTREGSTVADLGASGVTSEVAFFPDGTGVIDWRDGNGPFALLSSRRIPQDLLEALGQAIAAGDADGVGFTFVPRPPQSALVYGFACEIDGDFVGVEVLVGSREAQLPHFSTLDPTTVEVHDDHTIVTFNHHDGGPVAVRAVDDTTWGQLLADSSARGGP